MTRLRVAIYARFSSDKQNERSIDDQVALCQALCERKGFSIVGIYDDRAISGAATANRLGWLRLMRDARTDKFDIVLTEALDRISRDQADLAGIYKRLCFFGIEIQTVQDGKVEDIHVGIKGLMGTLYLRDLAQKTRRGQAGVIRDKRHNGGRSFGYRPVPGKPGVLEILPDQAQLVRRIFRDYAAGYSPRDIAAALNKEGIPGPRGSAWNASTIAGSRKRRNGVLQNELYVGRIIWNRQSFIKNPETGRRVSRANPESDWMTANVPELRIIDDALWDSVQRRREQRSGDRHYRSRPQRLLSGLLKCGCCGSSYVVSGADKRGAYLRCSRMLETGLCDNRRTIGVDAIEAIVIEGIEDHLAAPDMIAEYVREFHRSLAELHRTGNQHRNALQGRHSEVDRKIQRVIELLVDTPSRALKDHLADLERERDEIEAGLDAITTAPIMLNPDAAKSYRKKVKNLKAALAAIDEDKRAEAYQAIRGLIDKVVIRVLEEGEATYKPVEVDLYGRIQALFPESARVRENSKGVVVAGVGFEPTTFRL